MRATPRAHGMTIVELMVAVLLFAILSAGALTMFTGQQQTSSAQIKSADLLDNARTLLNVLAQQIRLAKAAAPEGNVRVNTGLAVPGGTNQCPANSGTVPVIEVTNSTTGPDQIRVLVPDGSAWGTLVDPMGTPPPGPFPPVNVGAATFQLRTLMRVSATQPAAGFVRGDLALLTDTVLPSPATRLLFRLTAAPVALDAAPPARFTITKTAAAAVYNAQPGSVMMRAHWLDYQVSTTLFGDELPALMVTDLVAGGSPEPAAAGIEDLQIALGVDSNNPPDGMLNESPANGNEWVFDDPAMGETLTGASAVTSPCDLARLRAVRISVVARARRSDPGAVLGRPAIEDHAAGAADGMYRVVLRTTVALR